MMALEAMRASGLGATTIFAISVWIARGVVITERAQRATAEVKSDHAHHLRAVLPLTL